MQDRRCETVIETWIVNGKAESLTYTVIHIIPCPESSASMFAPCVLTHPDAISTVPVPSSPARSDDRSRTVRPSRARYLRAFYAARRATPVANPPASLGDDDSRAAHRAWLDKTIANVARANRISSLMFRTDPISPRWAKLASLYIRACANKS